MDSTRCKTLRPWGFLFQILKLLKVQISLDQVILLVLCLTSKAPGYGPTFFTVRCAGRYFDTAA